MEVDPVFDLLTIDRDDLVATGNEVDEDAEVGQEDDEDRPDCLGSTAQIIASHDVAEDVEHQHDPQEEQEEPVKLWLNNPTLNNISELVNGTAIAIGNAKLIVIA